MRHITAAVLTLLAPSAACVAADKPNFLIFIADDMAWNDAGCYGHPHVRTPAIDRLAAQGVRFTNAFLTCSSCSPSRSSLITGRYPHSTGAEQLHWPLPAGQVTFAEILKRAGYWTAAVGKWHLGHPTKKDFDKIDGRVNKMPEVLAGRPKDKPFLMWAAFIDPHRGYQPNTIKRPHEPSDAVVPPFLPDVPETRKDLAMYYDEITRLDGVVGRTLAVLREQDAERDTVVIFMSDNGRPFPRCKTTVFDSGVKTPFIVRYPELVKPGVTCDRLVSSVDVAPTLTDLAGLPKPKSFQGVSFAPLLKNPAGEPVRQYVFAEHNWHDYSAHERAVRGPRFKYIANAYPELSMSPPADAVRSPTFEAMKKLRGTGKLTDAQRAVFVTPRPAEALYDTNADPHELTNLAGDPKYRDDLGRMRKALTIWKRRTGDGVPKVRTPDEFDRETGKRLPSAKRGPRTPQPGQSSRG